MSFGYRVLGFGSGGGSAPVIFDYLNIAGGGGGGSSTAGGGGGAGGLRTSFPGGTTIELEPGSYPITIGAGGAAGVPGDGPAGQDSVF